MKILISPDKFKGSLSAKEVTKAIIAGILRVIPSAQIDGRPMADGGEGTLDVLEDSLKLKRIYVEVSDPLFRTIQAYYGVKGKIAFVEMAKASGLNLLEESERNPMHATSKGTGELILHAIKNGAKEIYLFVGGSATNDGGMGIMSGLGYEFRDSERLMLEPIGRNMLDVSTIIRPQPLEGVKFILVTDVQNPLYGKDGAAYVYGAQKGASEDEIQQLDTGLKNLSKVIDGMTGLDVSKISGVGAAGGVGACLVGLLDAEIKPGVDTLMSIAGLLDDLAFYDLVVTGEGKIDTQTLSGKLIKGVTEQANKRGVDVLAVCGVNELSPAQWQGLGLKDCIQLLGEGLNVQDCISNAPKHITDRVEEMLRRSVLG